jgi:hypothetical protein
MSMAHVAECMLLFAAKGSWLKVLLALPFCGFGGLMRVKRGKM